MSTQGNLLQSTIMPQGPTQSVLGYNKHLAQSHSMVGKNANLSRSEMDDHSDMSNSMLDTGEN